MANQHLERWFFEYGFIGPHADADDSVVAAIEKLGFEFVYGGAVTDGDWQGYPAEFERLQEQHAKAEQDAETLSDLADALRVERDGLKEQYEGVSLALEVWKANHVKDTAYLITQRDEWKATAQKFEEQLRTAEEQRQFAVDRADVEMDRRRRMKEQLEAARRVNEQWEADYAACLDDLKTALSALQEIVRLHELHPTRTPYVWDIARRALADSSPASEGKLGTPTANQSERTEPLPARES